MQATLSLVILTRESLPQPVEKNEMLRRRSNRRYRMVGGVPGRDKKIQNGSPQF
jgi:hypothetical protein